MKKYILLVSLFFLIIIGCSKKANFDFNETDSYIYLKENKDNIKSLTIRYDTVSGRTCYNVPNDMINQMYIMLSNIILTNETNIVVSDNDDFYTFYFNDDTSAKFSFNGGNFIYKDKTYNITGYNPISISELEEYIIDCD